MAVLDVPHQRQKDQDCDGGDCLHQQSCGGKKCHRHQEHDGCEHSRTHDPGRLSLEDQVRQEGQGKDRHCPIQGQADLLREPGVDHERSHE